METPISTVTANLKDAITITWLPEEVMLVIFTEYQAYFQDEDWPFEPPYGWLAITHVCRLWRWYALRAPTLWSRIVVMRLESLQAMLLRSRSVPLSLIIDPHFEEMRGQKPALQLVRSNMHRIRHLALQDVDSLQIRVISQGKWGPQLESVHLYAYEFSWKDRFFCSSIKFLEISGEENRRLSARCATSLREMFDALRRMPLLEELSLDQSANANTMPGSDAGAVVTLRKLRLLMLVGTAKKVAFILNRISCPASTRLSLVAGIRTQMEMEQFFSSVAWKLSGEKSQAVSELRELNTVWLDIQQPNGFNFRGWREYQSRDILSNKKVLPTFREREDGDLNLTLNWNSFTEPPPMVWETKAIQKMCSFMPVQDAKHIYLVNARGDAISVIADLLFSDKHSPWPVITNLVLHKIDFSSKIAGVAEILSALFLRTRWNMPIENFVLLECTDVRETDITSLATVVEHVEWDGRT